VISHPAAGARVAAVLYGYALIGTVERWRAERADLLVVPGHVVATRISRCGTGRIDLGQALA
jgi:hypothetical protein